jgi:hypothetical protein
MANMFNLSHVMWHIMQVSTMPHGTYVKPRPCHMIHRLGYMCHMAHILGSRPCHVASRQGIGHATWHLA